jgi:hypothetical protein
LFSLSEIELVIRDQLFSFSEKGIYNIQTQDYRYQCSSYTVEAIVTLRVYTSQSVLLSLSLNNLITWIYLFRTIYAGISYD